MKPLFIFLTMLASFFTMSSFATEPTVSPLVLKSFQSRFADVKEVDWSVSATYYKAEFAFDGQVISAFFDTDGELMAMTRNITSLQLPIALQTELKKEHAGYWVTDLFEVVNESGTQYYVALENSDSKVVLKATVDSGWNTFQKSKKD
jgi:hypothetical protein